MRTLKRSECAVLSLVLKGRWYDMIASGEKREEYREAKPFWNKRINAWNAREGRGVIAFSRGYRKSDLFFEVKYAFCLVGSAGHLAWGEPNTPHWVIGLGERVELEGDAE